MNPYEFTGLYGECYTDPLNAMDARHVYTVHGILTAWKFKHALELGSWRGASSTAFVEAINAGTLSQATFCDTSIEPSLVDVLSNVKHDYKVRVTKDRSWEVLESGEVYDFILVDASHDIESVTTELARIIPREPLCVMAHDTNATKAGYHRCEGAQLLKQIFALSMPNYKCIEDAKKRDGERTDRGLFFATRDMELYEKAKEVFSRFAD